jgi:hypothetical protein
MATPTELKRAIARLAFDPFASETPLLDPQGHPVTYEITLREPALMVVKVPGPQGPHYFQIRVSELL